MKKVMSMTVLLAMMIVTMAIARDAGATQNVSWGELKCRYANRNIAACNGPQQVSNKQQG